MVSTVPSMGKSTSKGKGLSKLYLDKIARLRIGRTFQNIQLYTGLSTADNLMAARHFLFKSSWLEGALDFGRVHREGVNIAACCKKKKEVAQLREKAQKIKVRY